MAPRAPRHRGSPPPAGVPPLRLSAPSATSASSRAIRSCTIPARASAAGARSNAGSVRPAGSPCVSPAASRPSEAEAHSASTSRGGASAVSAGESAGRSRRCRLATRSPTVRVRCGNASPRRAATACACRQAGGMSAVQSQPRAATNQHAASQPPRTRMAEFRHGAGLAVAGQPPAVLDADFVDIHLGHGGHACARRRRAAAAPGCGSCRSRQAASSGSSRPAASPAAIHGPRSAAPACRRSRAPARSAPARRRRRPQPAQQREAAVLIRNSAAARSRPAFPAARLVHRRAEMAQLRHRRRLGHHRAAIASQRSHWPPPATAGRHARWRRCPPTARTLRVTL